jgi:hypothetical protein
MYGLDRRWGLLHGTAQSFPPEITGHYNKEHLECNFNFLTRSQGGVFVRPDGGFFSRR